MKLVRTIRTRATARTFTAIASAVAMAALAIALAWEQPAHAAAATYYVDSTTGSDGNAGTSSSAPWKALDKVDATAFSPGDTIAFRAGSQWSGQLRIDSSGTPSNPITVTSYGAGSKPRIDGGGATTAAVLLSNVHDVTFSGFEVTNTSGAPRTASTPPDIGIQVAAKDAGVLANITVQNSYVHNIDSGTGELASDPGAGGIIYTIRGNATKTAFDNLIIQNNEVADSDSYGISGYSTWMQRDDWNSLWDFLGIPSSEWGPFFPSTGMIIRGNTVHDVSAGAIAPLVVNGTLIEHNTVQRAASGHGNVAIWWANADSTTVQYNDVSATQQTAGDTDAAAFDADESTYGSLVQYNFSHGNLGGFFETISAANAGAEAIVRYNVSQNDGGGTDAKGRYTSIFKFYTNTSHVEAYNNTVYVAAGSAGAGAQMVLVNTASATGITFTNNIFSNPAALPYTNYGAASAITYRHNLYGVGEPQPSDASAVSAVSGDPKFASAGGASGFASLNAYSLGAGSAAAGSGVPVSGAGSRDILGSQVPLTSPDMGAIQTTGAARPTVTTSFASGQGTAPAVIADIDANTAWDSAASGVTLPGTIDLDYGTPQTFGAVGFGVSYGTGQGPSAVTIESWNGTSWVPQITAAPLRWASNTSRVEFRTIELPSRISTSKVRLVVTAANQQWGNIALNDVRLQDWTLPTAVASVASVAGTSPGNLVDLAPTATWSTPSSGYTLPVNLDIGLSAPRKVSSVGLSVWYGAGQGPTSISISTWNGSAWVQQTATTLSWASNSSTVETRSVSLPAPVTTRSVRITVTAANQTWGNIALGEVTTA